MISATLGLRSVFKAIASKELEQQLMAKFAPSAQVDWNVRAKELPDELYRVCSELRRKDKPAHDNLVCALQGICDVCADKKTPERLAREIKDGDLAARFSKAILAESLHLHACAAWLLLTAPDVWRHLLAASRALAVQARTYDEFATECQRGPDHSRIEILREAISSLLTRETLHGEHVHIEVDDEGDLCRYLVSINSFPNDVQQFDRTGNYALARDANAINFVFVYLPKTGMLRLKCSLNAAIRKSLARLFAEILLNTAVRALGNSAYDLSHHLQGKVEPSVAGSELLASRVSGLTVSFPNREGLKDTLCLATLGNTSLHEQLRLCLSAMGVTLGNVSVVAVAYTLTLPAANGRKTINAEVRPDGFHFICRDAREREIVRNYLKKVVA